MFDFNRLTRGMGFVFLAYFLSFPVLAFVVVVFRNQRLADVLFIFLNIQAPYLFCLTLLVLVIDLARRLVQRQVTTTQVVAYRVSGMFQLAGSVFALSTEHYLPPVVCVILEAVLFILPRSRALPTKSGG